MNKKRIAFLTCFLIVFSGIAQITAERLSALEHNRFDINFEQYNRNTSIYLALLSDLVYESEKEILLFEEKINLLHPSNSYRIELIQHEPSSTEVMLFGTKEFVVLAFKGTQEKKDHYTNSKFLGYQSKIDSILPHQNTQLQQLPSGHAGFRNGIIKLVESEQLLLRLEQFIEKVGGKKRETPVYTTGHSLGAALSSMIIPVLIDQEFYFQGAYHFAPPLAIWKKAGLQLKKHPIIQSSVYDIVNNTDYITRTPRYGRNNLVHIGKFYRIVKNQEEEPMIYREVERYIKYTFFEKLRPLNSLFKKYHYLSHYIAGVSFEKNTNSLIIERSKELDGCSAMKRRCSNKQYVP